MPRLLLLFAVACAVPPPARPSAAQPDAPTGRLAPPPEALRGSAATPAPQPVMPPMHHHHG